MKKIAILASGSGTTAEAIIHATQTSKVSFAVAVVIVNNSRAGVLTRVQRLNQQYSLNIKTCYISSQTHPEGVGQRGEQTLAESKAICEEINKNKCDLVALMGYMKKVRGALLKEYGGKSEHKHPWQARMINTHPGPLPETKGMIGLQIQEWILKNNLSNSAHTVHAVAPDYDSGLIFKERKVPVLKGDTPDTLFEAVQLTEKAHLAYDIQEFLERMT